MLASDRREWRSVDSAVVDATIRNSSSRVRREGIMVDFIVVLVDCGVCCVLHHSELFKIQRSSSLASIFWRRGRQIRFGEKVKGYLERTSRVSKS